MRLERLAGGAGPERLGSSQEAKSREERLMDMYKQIGVLQTKLEALEEEENLLIVDLLELSDRLDEPFGDQEEIAARQAKKIHRQEEINDEKGACQLQIGLLRADIEDIGEANRNLAEGAKERKN